MIKDNLSFIQQVVQQGCSNRLAELQHECFVFPTKRSGLYFQNELIKLSQEQTFWMPQIFSIQEFIEALTGKKSASEIELILHLFESYHQTSGNVDASFQKQTLDEFYDWGKILLRDFDTLFKYQVDAKHLFHYGTEWAKISDLYTLDEEVLAAIEELRNLLIETEQSKMVQQYTTIWDIVASTYETFHKKLERLNLNHEGMLFRDALAGLKDGEQPFNNVHFVGFNALSVIEERIFDWFWQADKAFFYWDIDTFYFDNKHSEAVTFLQKYKKQWKGDRSIWTKENKLQNISVHVYGCSGNISQLMQATSFTKEGNTCLVLCNEQLLVPLINVLPEEVPINITMGFKVQEQSLAQLCVDYLLLRKTKDNEFIPRDIVTSFLSHANVIQLLEDSNYQEILNASHRPLRLKQFASFWKGIPTIDQIWEVPMLEGLQILLQTIFQSLDEKENLDLEVTSHLLAAVEDLLSFYAQHSALIQEDQIALLFQQVLTSIRIPFEGASTDQLQIMGFLETRLLDFENVIICSANEGNLPSATQVKSFFPYSIRKAFQLPLADEQDGIYAYHFYRFLQRPKNIHILYNANPDMASGERSRFIDQLEYYLPKQQFHHYSLGQNAMQEQLSPTYSVIKNERLIKSLKKNLSASAVNTYLSCSLKFFLQYGAKIKEPEEIQTQIDARLLGNIVHSVLEKMYHPFLHKMVTKQNVQALLSDETIEYLSIQSLLKYDYRGFTSTSSPNKDNIIGQDILQFHRAKQMIRQALQLDLEYAPFTIRGIELSSWNTNVYKNNNLSVQIGGFIDRVDEKDGQVRIIDYKTGSVSLPNPRRKSETPEADIIEQSFTDTKFKSAYQALHYALIYNNSFSQKPIQAAIYELRKNNSVPAIYNGAIIDDHFLSLFQDRLHTVIDEIFDKSIPFEQTEDEDQCKYCLYQGICMRV